MKSFAILGLAFALAVLVGMPASAADDAKGRLTFTKDVLPILQENCQVCHRQAGKNMSGMIAPMSLVTYQEVRPWAKAIARVVGSKEMPPWHASELTKGHFVNERTITKDEIDTIVNWVKSGAGRGNPSDAPTPMTWPEGWSMEDPDLIVGFSEPYFVDDDVEDLYHNLTYTLTEDQLPEDKWISALEFKPGSEVVHHIITYSGMPEDGEVTESTGEEELLRGRTMLGGLAPGTDPADYPEGYGIKLHKGSEITFAMHYHKEAGPGTGQWDYSQMALKFHEKPAQYPLNISNIAHGSFEIPPYHGNWTVSGARTFKEDITILSWMPHMHLRGKAAKYTAFYPDGTSEVVLDIPQYDFNWQTQYTYDDLKRIPAGTRIEFEMVFDNSAENAERVGFNPARAVHFGGPTTDEMDLGWLTYAVTDKAEGQAGE